MSKFICEYRGPPRPFDKGLIRNIELSGQMLGFTTPVYDLMEPYLDEDIVAKAAAVNGRYPGAGVTAITDEFGGWWADRRRVGRCRGER